MRNNRKENQLRWSLWLYLLMYGLLGCLVMFVLM